MEWTIHIVWNGTGPDLLQCYCWGPFAIWRTFAQLLPTCQGKQPEMYEQFRFTCFQDSHLVHPGFSIDPFLENCEDNQTYPGLWPGPWPGHWPVGDQYFQDRKQTPSSPVHLPKEMYLNKCWRPKTLIPHLWPIYIKDQHGKCMKFQPWNCWV